GQFAIKRLDSAVATHHFENTSSAIVTCKRCFTEGGNTWFMWRATEFLLRMHEKDFAKASAIHQSISGHARFASQPEQVQEKWAFFGHYSEFASWTLDQSVPLLRRKSFERITRELPIYKRDKAGYNAALLILQQLIFASSGDRDGMIQKSESLKRYISRYLKNRRDTQLYAFLKMLILLEKCDFDIAQAERRGAGFIAQFRRYGHEIVDEKQTLPYDLMWDWIAEWTRKYAPKSQKSKPKNLPAAKKEETQWKALVHAS
ncbi:MAG TPA: hypothetical protein VFX22_04550, partial [Candidatus Kapabacteria bacterium]|nr:hypothetical protein [Candidatus Kapabacteria bacterium]